MIQKCFKQILTEENSKIHNKNFPLLMINKNLYLELVNINWISNLNLHKEIKIYTINLVLVLVINDLKKMKTEIQGREVII